MELNKKKEVDMKRGNTKNPALLIGGSGDSPSRIPNWRLRDSPKNMDLQTMIEKKKIYPITLLRGLSVKAKNNLMSNNIITIKQLVEKSPNELRNLRYISRDKLASLIDVARKIVFV